jgi:benzoyl-CoA reductase/2-hydroxyglutaryl-CoA dehydratase subunit BcrC/BadD/HgdB
MTGERLKWYAVSGLIDTVTNRIPSPASISGFLDAYPGRLADLQEEKAAGRKIIGTFCLFVPDEIIFAAGADRVILCGGGEETIPIGEEYLPRSVCPLVKSSFGAVMDSCCNGQLSCPHLGLVDLVVAEATCDSKKKMYEILSRFVRTYVIDLPQKPDTREAIDYFTGELHNFGHFLEELTGTTITDSALDREIRSANQTRRLLMRLYDLRRKDPPPIRGMDVIRVMQKQFLLSPGRFRQQLELLCDELERVGPVRIGTGPRILLSGCPMASGNTKVPEIVEERGGVIVAEESCTGTRSFWEPVDEKKEPWAAIAERYIHIPCSCMTPNERRVDHILELAEQFHVDGVVYYTLQNCHGYNIEKYQVQQALKMKKIPLLAIETDYGDSDREQIGTRVDAFLEMIT